MKKTFFAILLSAAIAAGVFAQNGVIRELTGEVEIKPSGASSFTAAKAGDAVARDTIVSTGFRSTAVITVGSSTITVRPLTRLSLAEIQSASDAENVNVNLQTGRVRVDVRPPAGTRTNLTVQSTTASASVRGTSFEFDTLNLSVTEGTVSFGGISAAPAVMVQAGGSSFIGTDGNAVSPAEISAASLMPPAPVGTDASSSGESSVIVTDGSSSTGQIIVTPEY
jgi:hypothetical protein